MWGWVNRDREERTLIAGKVERLDQTKGEKFEKLYRLQRRIIYEWTGIALDTGREVKLRRRRNVLDGSRLYSRRAREALLREERERAGALVWKDGTPSALTNDRLCMPTKAKRARLVTRYGTFLVWKKAC